MRAGLKRKVLVLTGALLTAAPAGATSSSELAPAAAVDAFAVRRAEAPLWLADPAATQLLLQRLRSAELDGFARGPALADAADAALARARTGDAAAKREAERLLTASWVMYVQALHWPSAGMEFADRSLAPAIPSTSVILQQLATAPSLAEHVRRVSDVNPLYAELRTAAMSADPALKDRLEANLNRARALPAHGRFVLVDLASQRLTMWDEGRPVDSMKVVVGKAEMRTPLLAGTIREATFNPYWNVPTDLVASRLAPNVLRSGPGWLQAKGYEVLSGWEPDATVVPATGIDWHAVASGRTELRVRQRPGRDNMMGAMKFEFPNAHGIYLHDTPERNLFAKDVRTYSSGCIRLEDAPRLGRWLLGREPVGSGSAPEEAVPLPQPVPVYLTYLTARVDGGRLVLVDDIYGLDGAVKGKEVAAK